MYIKLPIIWIAMLRDPIRRRLYRKACKKNKYQFCSTKPNKKMWKSTGAKFLLGGRSGRRKF